MEAKKKEKPTDLEESSRVRTITIGAVRLACGLQRLFKKVIRALMFAVERTAGTDPFSY